MNILIVRMFGRSMVGTLVLCPQKKVVFVVESSTDAVES